VYTEYVWSQWHDIHIEGWRGFVLKEKLKRIKERLKTWHQNHVQNLDGRMKQATNRISSLDTKGGCWVD